MILSFRVKLQYASPIYGEGANRAPGEKREKAQGKAPPNTKAIFGSHGRVWLRTARVSRQESLGLPESSRSSHPLRRAGRVGSSRVCLFAACRSMRRERSRPRTPFKALDSLRLVQAPLSQRAGGQQSENRKHGNERKRTNERRRGRRGSSIRSPERRPSPRRSRKRPTDRPTAIWLILPVVICLSQRLSHACLSSHCFTVKPRMAH